MIGLTALAIITVAAVAAAGPAARPPYPPSRVIKSIHWDWDTHRTAAPGSDLWPVAWAEDGNLYASWGDGGGFGGTDSDGRVAMGIARIEGGPEDFRGVNVNGGKNPEHPASFPTRGKTGGMIAVDGVLYAWLNTQDTDWPNVDFRLCWSEDRGATWKTSDWKFARGPGRVKPATFLSFGPADTDTPASLGRYVYFYGFREGQDGTNYLGRAPRNRLRDRDSYEFLSSLARGNPTWSRDVEKAAPVFVDPPEGGPTVSYIPALKRYLAASFHGGPGQFGVFDAPQPWGPWTTVEYEEIWGNLGPDGEGLTCSFPQKWMSADGLTLWCVFSVYGPGGKQGVLAHDRFNLVRATLELRHPGGSGEPPGSSSDR